MCRDCTHHAARNAHISHVELNIRACASVDPTIELSSQFSNYIMIFEIEVVCEFAITKRSHASFTLKNVEPCHRTLKFVVYTNVIKEIRYIEKIRGNKNNVIANRY